MDLSGVSAHGKELAEMLAAVLVQNGYTETTPATLDDLLKLGRSAAGVAAGNRGTSGWTALLSSAFDVSEGLVHIRNAEKLKEVLHHLARGNHPPVFYPPAVAAALTTAATALDRLAAGDEFNQVVEETGVTAAVSAARISVEAVEALAPRSSGQDPVVVVEINGGVINCIRANMAAHVVILDEDTEGVEPLRTVDGSEYYVTEQRLSAFGGPGQPGVDPDFVARVIEQLNGQTDGYVEHFHEEMKQCLEQRADLVRELAAAAAAAGEDASDEFRWDVIDALKGHIGAKLANNSTDSSEEQDLAIAAGEDWVASNISSAGIETIIAAAIVLDGADETARRVGELAREGVTEKGPTP